MSAGGERRLFLSWRHSSDTDDSDSGSHDSDSTANNSDADHADTSPYNTDATDADNSSSHDSDAGPFAFVIRQYVKFQRIQHRVLDGIDAVLFRCRFLGHICFPLFQRFLPFQFLGNHHVLDRRRLWRRTQLHHALPHDLERMHSELLACFSRVRQWCL